MLAASGSPTASYPTNPICHDRPLQSDREKIIKKPLKSRACRHSLCVSFKYFSNSSKYRKMGSLETDLKTEVYLIDRRDSLADNDKTHDYKMVFLSLFALTTWQKYQNMILIGNRDKEWWKISKKELRDWL
jgi:hypothetical protein